MLPIDVAQVPVGLSPVLAHHVSCVVVVLTHSSDPAVLPQQSQFRVVWFSLRSLCAAGVSSMARTAWSGELAILAVLTEKDLIHHQPP